MIEMLSQSFGFSLPAAAGFPALLLVKGGLIVLVGYGFGRLLAGASAAARHTVWSAAFAGLLLLPLLAYAVPGWSLAVLPAAPAAARPPVAEVAASEAAEPGGRLGEQRAMPVATAGGDADVASGSTSGVQWSRVLPILYLVGLGLMLGRLGAAIGLVWLLGRRGRRLTELPRWSALLRSLAGPRSRIELVMSSRVRVPMVWGWRRPTVLVPAAAEEWSEAQLRDALVHELAHVERGDWPVQIAARIVCAIYWFHPLVWMARRQLVLEAERACDDQVVAAGAESHDYAEQLVSLARAASRWRIGGAVTMARRTQLSGRISALLDRRQRRNPLGLGAAAGLALAVLLPALLLAPVRLVQASAGRPQADHWLEEDEGEQRSREGRLELPAAVEGTPLMRAAAAGDRQEVQRLLAAGADPDEAVAGGGSPLILAARAGYLEVVELLLDAGADPERTETVGPRHSSLPRSPMGAAALSGRVEILDRLLAAGADVDVAPRGDATPLMIAAEQGHAAAVRRLIAAGADVDAIVRGDGSPMIAATRSGDLEVVEEILAAGADADTWVGGDESPLFHAVAGGDLEIVRRLLDAGANPNASWPGDGSPLIVAAAAGHDEVIEELLAAGADPSQAVSGDGSPLIVAAGRGDAEGVRRLLAAGAPIDQGVEGDGSALIAAARSGKLDVVELLVERGADIERIVPGDENALISAAGAGELEVVRYLLDRGADPNVQVLANPGRRQEIRTALKMARRGGHREVVELLLARDAVE